MPSKSNLRIGNVSGATGDHPHAMVRMATSGQVDVITGDWLSEMNIAWNAIVKKDFPDLGYEAGFLAQLEESIDSIVSNKIKVITNAGALNTLALTKKVRELCQSKGFVDIVIASVLGDDVSDLVTSTQGKGGAGKLMHLDYEDRFLEDWELEPYCGAAYIGAAGIKKALQEGADIVICGRVTDASPVIGAAAWWYDWDLETSYDELAGALIAGHLIECGPYITGANFSGFKEYLPQLIDLGFPIAEILHTGACYISKAPTSSGTVNKFNVTAQLVYELQGVTYLNPDVVADVSLITIEATPEKDKIYVSGAKGTPPPSTTKVMVAASGGYQAETTFYINGLDVEEKAQMMKQQLMHVFKDNKFSKLSIELYGGIVANPTSQQEGTVHLRVFAQARRKEDISAEKFRIPIYALRMQSYPGYHMNLDFRTMDPKPFMEIFPATIPLSVINHRVILHEPGNSSPKEFPISPPTKTQTYSVLRHSSETAAPVDLSIKPYGATKYVPLGSIVHARSGDKANNSNVGFFVRHQDEYPWLQSTLSISKIKELLGDDWLAHEQKESGREKRIERCEFPNIWAVHFRIMDFLDGGIASSSRIDGLGKGIGEYLRSKYVDIPVKFLDRGTI